MHCELSQGSIHYETFGEGKPILVLHAMGTDHRAMSAWMEPIFDGTADWKRIYCDLPAHGKSRIDPSVRGTEDFLAMLLEFVDRVLPDERFAIAGMSYGGLLAQGIIHHRPERIDGICLIAPNVQLAEGERDLPAKRVLEKDDTLLATLEPDIRTAFETLFILQNERSFRAFLEQIQPGRELADRNFLGSDWRKHHYFFREAPTIHTEVSKQPALIVLGKHDSIAGYGDQLRLAERFLHATTAVLDQTGHMIPIECTALLKSLTIDWLDRMAKRQKGSSVSI
ncbi:alpha/beta fold hydrolase [Cohnella candidum]|uniref:Alpha/beta hydrolase n=1 Tax=Cohnella candidum TaxID=2674991 RepID=A0A3G3JYG6_9BACL|nr:alpha/beta hydrolase [Cohnella candidum]AYQ72897.1 alpha/beta hydrolase [Cohnella candidum]